jgi:chromosome segregation ATPase
MESKKMIEKIVKQYDRTKDGKKIGYIQRIDFNKFDNLKKNQTIYILTEKELEDFKNQNKENSKKLKEFEQDYNDKINQLEQSHKEKIDQLENQNKEINNKLDEKEKTITNQTEQLTNLFSQLDKAINDKNDYKTTIAGLRILIEKYKNRGIIERIFNNPIKLTEEDKESIEDKNIIEAEFN